MSVYKRIDELYLELDGEKANSVVDENADNYDRIMNAVEDLILQDKGREAIKMIEEEYGVSTDLPSRRIFVPYLDVNRIVVIADLESDPSFDLTMNNGKIADIGFEDLFEDEENENLYISDLLKEINSFLRDNEYPDMKEEECVPLIRDMLTILESGH